MADLLLETKLDEEQREYVNAARLCAESLFEILNATLEYSALEAGHLTLDESEFSLRELIESTLAQQTLKAESKGLGDSRHLRLRIAGNDGGRRAAAAAIVEPYFGQRD